MRLIDNWWIVLKRSWTARAGYIGAILNGIYVAVYLYTSTLLVPPIWLILFNGALAAVVPLLRVTPQKNISGVSDADR